MKKRNETKKKVEKKSNVIVVVDIFSYECRHDFLFPIPRNRKSCSDCDLQISDKMKEKYLFISMLLLIAFNNKSIQSIAHCSTYSFNEGNNPLFPEVPALQCFVYLKISDAYIISSFLSLFT